jgi:hypothetical protein
MTLEVGYKEGSAGLAALEHRQRPVGQLSQNHGLPGVSPVGFHKEHWHSSNIF